MTPQSPADGGGLPRWRRRRGLPGRARARRGELPLARVESFSDCVFSFAMTLLVLGLVVPKLSEVHSDAQLLSQLGRQWPTFVAYLVSFVFIGQVWLQHHRLLGYLARADHWAVWLNAALLLDVVSISFVTGLLGTYAGHPGQTAAAVIYGITWAVGGLFFNRPVVVCAPRRPRRPGAHPRGPAEDQRPLGERADPVHRLHVAGAGAVLGRRGRLRGPGCAVPRSAAPGAVIRRQQLIRAGPAATDAVGDPSPPRSVASISTVPPGNVNGPLVTHWP